MLLEEGGGGGRGDLKERVLRLWRDLCWGCAGGVWVTGRWGSSYSGRRFLLFFCFHQLEKFRVQVNHNKFYNIICPQTHTFHQHDNKRANSRIQHFVHLWYVFFWYLDLFKSRRLYHQLSFISNFPCEKSKYPNIWKLKISPFGDLTPNSCNESVLVLLAVIYSPHHFLTITHTIKWIYFIIIIKKKT